MPAILNLSHTTVLNKGKVGLFDTFFHVEIVLLLSEREQTFLHNQPDRISLVSLKSVAAIRL